MALLSMTSMEDTGAISNGSSKQLEGRLAGMNLHSNEGDLNIAGNKPLDDSDVESSHTQRSPLLHSRDRDIKIAKLEQENKAQRARIQTLLQENREISRLRGLRNHYRQESHQHRQETDQLRAEVNRLKGLSNQKNDDVLFVSDDEDQSQRVQRFQVNQPGPLPTSTLPDTFTSRSPEPSPHIKYPKLDHFAGDREDWPRWRVELESKLGNAAVCFPSEWSKIEYTRDHCKDTAWKTI